MSQFTNSILLLLLFQVETVLINTGYFSPVVYNQDVWVLHTGYKVKLRDFNVISVTGTNENQPPPLLHTFIFFFYFSLIFAFLYFWDNESFWYSKSYVYDTFWVV